MAYSRDDIEKVRQAADLVELVGAVTKVKRSGRSFLAICPFHQEKSPSLSLDPARGLYHCFGCQKGGDVFTFLEETQGLDFNEAVEELARRTGIQVEADAGADRRRGRRNTLHEVVRRAIEVYHRILREAPEAGPARAYLRGRGYDADVVEEYRLGYAPEAWDTLVRELRAGGVGDQTMIDAGLARRGRGGRVFDYFRGRVMFPIHDLRGDPAGFGGRTLEAGGAKYINSPDSVIYNKARLLYGLDRARTAVARSGRSVVVEGYTDVIALHRAGVPETVATCGTALTEEHFDLLRRFAERVVLAFDADEAGTEAARRTFELEAPVSLDLDMRVAVMPDGGDPADIVQAGRVAELLSALESAKPLVLFRIEQEAQKYNTHEPEGRARALKEVAQIVARLPREVASGDYVRVIPGIIGVSREAVERAINDARRREGWGKATNAVPARESDKRRLEKGLLRLLIARTAGTEDLGPDVFSESDLRASAEALLTARERDPDADVDHLELSDTARSILIPLALDPSPMPDTKLIARARLEAQIEEIEHQVLTSDPGSEAYSQAFKRLIALQREKRRT